MVCHEIFSGNNPLKSKLIFSIENKKNVDFEMATKESAQLTRIDKERERTYRGQCP